VRKSQCSLEVSVPGLEHPFCYGPEALSSLRDGYRPTLTGKPDERASRRFENGRWREAYFLLELPKDL